MSGQPNLSEKDKRDLAYICASTDRFGKFFFPEYFVVAQNKFHKVMDTHYESGFDQHKKMVLAPRGVGKTTRVLLGKIARHICLRDRKFIVFITNTSTLAEMHTENLRRALRKSPRIKKFFGDIKPLKIEGNDDTFGKEAWVTQWGTMVLPRGQGQQVRGLLHDGQRPDLIVYDDLENKDILRNEEQRRKLRTWFFAEPMKCNTRYDKNFEHLYQDTLKHEDCLGAYLLEDPSWESDVLAACDDNLRTNDSTYMTQQEVHDEYEEHKRVGALDVFYMEFMNQPTANEDRSFKAEHYRYFAERTDVLIPYPKGATVDGLADKKTNIRIPKRELISVVIIDPAKTKQVKKIQTAETAIIGISFNRTKANFYIRRCVSERMYPDEIYQAAIDMTFELGAGYIGLDTNSLDLFIEMPLQQAMLDRRCNAIMIPMKCGLDKESRVGQMSGYYRQGMIWHKEGVECNVLEAQLHHFPNARLWDLMDALGYLPLMIEKLSALFPNKLKEPERSDIIIQIPGEFNIQDSLGVHGEMMNIEGLLGINLVQNTFNAARYF